MTEQLQKQLEMLPNRPGIYKFLDASGEILYVGKAINLTSRVRSYFSDNHLDRPHIIPMIDKISSVEVIEADNEIEALVLEAALIKQYQPNYNVMLKDDKSYSWIFISTKDEVPKIKIVRSIKPEEYKNGKLFGPYPSGRAIMQVFKYIRKLHPFCACKNPKEPCLYYRMGMCNNPIFDEYTNEEYREGIDEIIKFLQGNKKRHILELKRDMYSKAQSREYERAAILRDRIADLEHLGDNIKYYKNEKDFHIKRERSLETELGKIQKDASLAKLPLRIECYDISNTQGKEAFGSMTVALKGELSSSHYRIFKIKTLDTPNDYAMLDEVLQRRIRHIKDGKDASLSSKPHVIIIDGGKGQLTSVSASVPSDIVLMGISKGRSRRKKGLRLKDQFWIRNTDTDEIDPVRISTPRILATLRDEAHRFSLKHHRKLRGKTQKKSLLDTIPGIGSKRKKALLEKFGSVKGMSGNDFDELNAILNSKTATEALLQALSELK